MKKILPLLLLGLLVCAGCASQYTLTLTNGDRITSRGKPRYDKDKNLYFFTDPQGRPAQISGFKVREVSPTSMMDKGGGNYLPRN